jgi:predicted  nucleic acid-binding Zn-ribbon protein
MTDKISEQEFSTLRRRVANAKTDRDRAAGSLQAAMERLNSDFECRTIAEAEKKLEEMQREAEKAEQDFAEAVANFEQEWDEQQREGE